VASFDRDPQPELLPENFLRWFAARGWSPRDHQLALLAKARAGRSALLIAPTGAGKTLAGFLPTLVELIEVSAPMRSSPLPPRHPPSPEGYGGRREGRRRRFHRTVVSSPPVAACCAAAASTRSTSRR
jgi:ATP-dependent Lhr-like helicase